MLGKVGNRDGVAICLIPAIFALLGKIDNGDRGEERRGEEKREANFRDWRLSNARETTPKT